MSSIQEQSNNDHDIRVQARQVYPLYLAVPSCDICFFFFAYVADMHDVQVYVCDLTNEEHDSCANQMIVSDVLATCMLSHGVCYRAVYGSLETWSPPTTDDKRVGHKRGFAWNSMY
jgi:hypothetical protein